MELTQLPGVGPALAEKFRSLGLAALGDLLFHLPLRYEDRTRLTPLGALAPGEWAQVAACIRNARVGFGARRSLSLRLVDEAGDELIIRLFHFSQRQLRQFVNGQWLRAYGEVRQVGDHLEMIHPEYRLLPQAEAQIPESDHLTPVYPVTSGLSQRRMRQAVGAALRQVLPTLEDVLADAAALPLTLEAALRQLHSPAQGEGEAHALAAQQRLAMEELLAHRLAMLRLRASLDQTPGPPIPPGQQVPAFLDSLPFTLTQAQQRVLSEIRADLARPTPMLRLLQGDVGCGKTVVAAGAAVAALEAGQHVLLMAPTEILARQHAKTLSDWLVDFPWSVQLALGGARGRGAEALGDAPTLVVGTHALLYGEAAFPSVGLIVVDEQHRFGVDQRLRLRERASVEGVMPHQLVMTATPIPRTMAQSLYADLDMSIIDERPPGRQPVTTVAMPQDRRDAVIERLHAACQSGRQAYWVSPVIESSEWAEAAEDIYAALQQALPDLQIGLVHGRLKAAEKQAVMNGFAGGELQILVATTVIEVGVDVPNASVMVIDNAERMGLAQLHQLRGRVGRGATDSHCLLLYRPPLSETGRARLQALREEQDGFALAERDLALRGSGDILGARQSGMASFKIADPQRDAKLLSTIAPLASQLQHRGEIVDTLLARWLGEGQRYADI